MNINEGEKFRQSFRQPTHIIIENQTHLASFSDTGKTFSVRNIMVQGNNQQDSFEKYLSNLSETSSVDVSIRTGADAEVVDLPENILQRIADYFRNDPKKNGNFDCASFVHYINNTPYQFSEFWPGDWNISELKNTNNLHAGDTIFLAPTTNLRDSSITHFGVYLNHDLFISKFGKSGPLIVTGLEEMKTAFDSSHVFQAKPKRELVTPDSIEKYQMLAKNLPAVRNGLVSEGQAIYSMLWKTAVNPNSTPYVLWENAKGADMTTSYLASDAHFTFVSNDDPMRPEVLAYELSRWENVDTDENDKYTLSKTQDKTFSKTLNHKKKLGYWNSSDFTSYSMERCIIAELKLLGVNPNTIRITDLAGQAILSYELAYPGEKAVTRTNYYLNAYTRQTFEALTEKLSPSLVQVDGFYEKAADMIITKEYSSDPVHNRSELIPLGKFIRPLGITLIGTEPLRNSEQAESDARSNRMALGKNFIPLILPENKFTDNNNQSISEPNSIYGWKVYGSRKSAENPAKITNEKDIDAEFKEKTMQCLDLLAGSPLRLRIPENLAERYSGAFTVIQLPTIDSFPTFLIQPQPGKQITLETNPKPSSTVSQYNYHQSLEGTQSFEIKKSSSLFKPVSMRSVRIIISPSEVLAPQLPMHGVSINYNDYASLVYNSKFQ